VLPLAAAGWAASLVRPDAYAALVKNRAVPFARYVDVARMPASATERAVDQSLVTARRALQRRPWVMGGIDEAGCEDEIVQVSVR
jgi:hypothetical protein